MRFTFPFALLPFLLLCIQPGSAQTRGQVTSAACPYSCRTQGIPKKKCRDWREGNKCFIEDLSKKPKPVATARPLKPVRPIQPPGSTAPHSSGKSGCKRGRMYHLARPRVILSKVKKTGNFFEDKYKVYGSVEGVCLVEAGAFEDGRKRQNIAVRTVPQFQRYEFSVVVRESRNPEIRAYNVNGEADFVDVRPRDFGSDGRPEDDDDDRHYDQDDDSDARDNGRPPNLLEQIFGGR